MAIQFGNDKIKEIYVGGDKIKEVYHGADLVWSGKKTSYAVTTYGTRINFEFENTPMSNFETFASIPSITLNGISYGKSDIKEITFGISYGQVTSIGDNFLNMFPSLLSIDLSAFVNVTSISDSFINNCHSLLSIDLSAFVNVTSISDSFINNCHSLPSIDLSAFVNVTSIGMAFIANCGVLNILYIGTIVPPTLEIYSFYNSPIQYIYVPAQSMNAYKTATTWTAYADIISAI